jgi:hypothetical protein
MCNFSVTKVPRLCYSVGRKDYTMLILGFVYAVGVVFLYLRLERVLNVTGREPWVNAAVRHTVAACMALTWPILATVAAGAIITALLSPPDDPT